MKLVYHGTSVENAVGIAKAGAILSSWYNFVREIRESFGSSVRGAFPNEEAYVKHFGKSVEEVALRAAASLYSERELEHRAKSVSLTPNIALAGGYARYFDNYGGGVMLSCEVTPKIAEVFPQDWENRNVIFVPRKFDLDTLKEVYLTERVVNDGSTEEAVREAFERFSPRYSVLFKDGSTIRMD